MAMFGAAIVAFIVLASTDAPLWLYAAVAVVVVAIAGYVNHRFPVSPRVHQQRQATELPGYFLGALAVGGLGIAAAIAKDNAFVGIGGVVAAAALIAGLRLTRDQTG